MACDGGTRTGGCDLLACECPVSCENQQRSPYVHSFLTKDLQRVEGWRGAGGMDFSTLKNTIELLESWSCSCCCCLSINVLALGGGGPALGAHVECLGWEFSIKSGVSDVSHVLSLPRHAALDCCRAFAAACVSCQLSHQSRRGGAGGLPGCGFGAIARE